jgi:predicted secreted protein
MTKNLLKIISKVKFLIPLYLLIFHCSLPVDPAEFAPQNLKYEKELYILYVGDTLNAKASVEYSVDSFTISPTLPTGLNLDKSTGTISGKCNNVLPQTTFTVQAFNKNGSTPCILKIEILLLPTTDTIPPVITRVTPAKDSASTNSTSYTIKITCTDSSGVASVKGTLGSQSFTGTKGAGDDWTILVSGLVVNTINKMTITATDSSTKPNQSTINYYIECDPTMVDNEPPTVYFSSPLKDTVIGVDSFTVTAVCKDPSGITTLTGMSNATPFIMSKSATADSIWTGTVKGLTSGAYTTIKLIATDASVAQNKDSVSVRIKYDKKDDNDVTGPVITRVTPANDSVSTNATSYTIKISCTDLSGVASVKGALGTQSFTGTKGTGNDWTIAVSGLAVNVLNTIIITATDSSLKANTSTLNYYVKCDPTMGDNIPPTVYFTSPVKDTIIGVDSFAITAVCKDPSSITSLTGMINLTSFIMNKSATVDSIWTGTVKGLPSGAYATIKLVATDASTAKNKDSVSVRIKYDGDIAGPVMTRGTPAKDSVSTNATSYTITISCTDASGVVSVNGTLGSQSFTGARGAGNDWTIAVTGLTANVFNSVVITAKDSSLRANPSTLNFYIKCDPTMLDSIGPTIVQKSGPVSGAIVTNAVVDIIVSTSDPSGIDNVSWTRNGGTKKTMTPVTGSTDQYSLKDTLTEGKFDTLLVTAVDKSTRGNPSTQTIILKYIKAPAISIQPVSKTVCAGSPATFTVTATGTAPLLYQWRNGTANINGETNSSYTPSTTSGGQTVLSCVVSNGASTSATSSLCTLTVNLPPTITGPTNQTTCAGTNATLSVSASGATGFQWYLGTSILTGATSASYSTTTAGSYYCVVTSSGCSATSNSATVTINTPPTITGPTNQTTCAGTNATLSVSASGATGFQWYLGTSPSGSILTGATSASYSTSTAGSYYCVVTKDGCSATSNSATVTVNTPPTITGPTNQTTCAGINATLSVSASGATGFQWYLGTSPNGSILTGATSASYSTSTAGSYYCVVTKAGCSATSNAATLTVNAPPTISKQPVAQTECAGSNWITFKVTSTGIHFQWRKNGAIISDGDGTIYQGAKTYSLSVTALASNAGDYTCDVSNDDGCSVTSAPANLTINRLTVTAPSNLSLCENETGSMSVSAPCGSSFKWYFIDSYGNEAPVTTGAAGEMMGLFGAETPTLTFNPYTNSLHPADYYCLVSDGLSSVKSTAATLSTKASCP